MQPSLHFLEPSVFCSVKSLPLQCVDLFPSVGLSCSGSVYQSIPLILLTQAKRRVSRPNNFFLLIQLTQNPPTLTSVSSLKSNRKARSSHRCACYRSLGLQCCTGVEAAQGRRKQWDYRLHYWKGWHEDEGMHEEGEVHESAELYVRSATKSVNSELQ